MTDRLVAADDRTGSFEVAAWMADAAGPVTVWVGEAGGDGVVDLGTRNESAEVAVERVRALPKADWRGHKTDSLLRGNWAAEVRALDARVLLVPAWPEMGRVCIGGVVHAAGERVGAIRDRLPEAGLLADLDAVRRWLEAGEGVGVADTTTSEQMHLVAALLSSVDDVVVAGPAGPIGAAHRARFGGRAAAVCPAPVGPVVVVNGSASPVAHEQVRRLRAGRPDIEVLSVPEGVDGLRPEVAQAVAAEAVASAARASTIVVIGGDTAAALLGEAPRRVGGFAAPGMPWSLEVSGGGPLVITKAGAFGGPDALLALRLP